MGQNKTWVMIGSNETEVRFVKFDNVDLARDAISNAQTEAHKNGQVMYEASLSYTGVNSAINSMKSYIETFLEGFSVGRQHIYPDEITEKFRNALFIFPCQFITYGNPWYRELLNEIPSTLNEFKEAIELREIECDEMDSERKARTIAGMAQ